MTTALPYGVAPSSRPGPGGASLLFASAPGGASLLFGSAPGGASLLFGSAPGGASLPPAPESRP